jgi:hypothetical protein
LKGSQRVSDEGDWRTEARLTQTAATGPPTLAQWANLERALVIKPGEETHLATGELLQVEAT